ncbi:hypothetical protein COW36_15925 [bacterium (Candidatus Blackallbacteria) CG17_big_fil_post_rev_8_21_14_2_50_48_46]|uniref:SLH domain-containing protein n=1 Tax=bacterium (Candidatus Blackallbacteria) CG17_big_fil_post_rev_8_21_14_2_50_48_46 TaxID=2014261 RepID=A0A2M7G1X0_9BACT|nr:MAG: hypothetical protein COW64_09075 [bacterium (Candidatus Blackallbacteria) CG18_big_fil_WC_8_21_14_2_50_49_26]PIW15756.1 MAG: hypothetical protein COW36_15925 [bacterium (Candidatus Blackallbacteria) CG17_big_fil_post_rev_8_21_14_2_50_48_46]PIW48746.1 MAG: hypothetical protein COW20_08330 [bacterium (Candidatus Blackallbacteria) CG13_big_fil_rev_8_21_14_2_50_49_14]
MQRSVKTALLALTALTLVSGLPAGAQTAAQAPGYSDVPADHWAAGALKELAEKHQIQLRYPDGEFKGQRALTRYEMAALLVQVLRQLKASEINGSDKALLKALQTEFNKELETLKLELQEDLNTIQDRLDLLDMGLEETKEGILGALAHSLPFNLSGDLAFRHELVTPEFGNFEKATTNTPQTRITLSLNSRGKDVFGYGARLSVGNLRNPGNPWWRLGDFNARVEFALDRFFIVWRPSSFLDLTAGKFQNVFSNSELLMDFDVQPEGAMQQLHFDQISEVFRSFSLTLGETIINMNKVYQGNTFLLSGKADAKLVPLSWMEIDLSAAYHQYIGESVLYTASQLANDNGLSQPIVGNQMTNTLNTAFSILNGAAKVNLQLGELGPLQVSFDYLRNLAAASGNQAYQAGLQWGAARNPGDFFVGYFLKYLEKDAAVSYFVEDQLGGTNLLAHEGQVGVKVWDKTTLFATYQYKDSLTQPGAPIHTLRTGIHQAF